MANPKTVKSDSKSAAASAAVSSKPTTASEAAVKAAVEAIQKSVSKTSKKTDNKKKEELSVVPEPTSVVESASASASASATDTATTAVEGGRKRREVTRELLESSFDELLAQIDKEVESLRADGNKGTRFLRSVAKTIRQLKSASLRLSVKRTRRQTAPRSTNSGFMKPVKVSKEMQKFTGIKDEQLVSRVDVTKAICLYVKEHNLQNNEDRRQFTPDEKLSKLLNTTQPLTYYNLQKHIQHHFIKL